MIKSKLLQWILILAFAIVMLIINYTVIYNLLFPDICYYHTHKMNWVLRLFYNTNPVSNGHPEPNLFNLFLTLSIGGVFGYGVYKAITHKSKKATKA